MLAGAVIAFMGGGGDASTLSWTPPAPTVAAPTPERIATITPAPTREPSVTPAPPASPTRVRPTATPSRSATPQPEAVATLATVARILQGPANLRVGPGTGFVVARVANEGETFEATGQTADGAWLRLCCVDGAPVWVAGDLIELPAGASLPAVNP
jgi:hypothetical protein